MTNTLPTSIDVPKSNISAIDLQYQKIKLLVENMSKSCKENTFEKDLSTIFYGLLHIKSHYFIQEQITLAKYHYEGLTEVKNCHKSFIEGVIQFREKMSENVKLNSVEMFQFVVNWSKNYFEVNEKAIQFLISKGVK